MSRRKRGSGADELYRNHLAGGQFANNPAVERTAVIERMYLRILTELCSNRFKWSGMPKTVDLRFLELTEYYRGVSIFYDDPEYGFLALQGGGTNFLNMMNNPTGFQVVGNNFVSKTISAKDCVPIWANYMRMPDIDIVTIYATKLAQLDRTIEINSDNARQSKVIITPDNQRLSYENINRQISEGQNNIKVNGAAMQDLSNIIAVDLGINPDTLEKLHILRTRLWSECMGLLGIDNANQDKKERLVAAEVDANSDQTSMMRYVNLNARRMACEQINAKYGLNVSVEYYTDADREAALEPDAEDDNKEDDAA